MQIEKKQLVTVMVFSAEISVAGCGRYHCMPEQVNLNAMACCGFGVTTLV